MPAGATAPLFNDLGTHHYAVTTQSALAQRYFDQGLTLVYAFNHAEAVRSFREAQRLDPACAMCFWGEALALGPNINKPMDDQDVPGRVGRAQQSEGARQRRQRQRASTDPRARDALRETSREKPSPRSIAPTPTPCGTLARTIPTISTSRPSPPRR